MVVSYLLYSVVFVQLGCLRKTHQKKHQHEEVEVNCHTALFLEG
jgi:hypothetical protein